MWPFINMTHVTSHGCAEVAYRSHLWDVTPLWRQNYPFPWHPTWGLPVVRHRPLLAMIGNTNFFLLITVFPFGHFPVLHLPVIDLTFTSYETVSKNETVIFGWGGDRDGEMSDPNVEWVSSQHTANLQSLITTRKPRTTETQDFHLIALVPTLENINFFFKKIGVLSKLLKHVAIVCAVQKGNHWPSMAVSTYI